MERICAWCNKVLSPGNTENGPTHTICPDCKKKVEEEIRQLSTKKSNTWYGIYRAGMALPLNSGYNDFGGEAIDELLTPKYIEYINKLYPLKSYLGEGQMGIAYLMKDGRVLKITSSREEFTLALQLRNKTDLPVVKIHSCKQLTKKVFLIVKDRITPLEMEQEEIVEYALRIDEVKKVIESFVEKEIKSIADIDIDNAIAESNNADRNALAVQLYSGIPFQAASTKLKGLITEARDYIVENFDLLEKAVAFRHALDNFPFTDARGENCGFDPNGNLVIFDFGRHDDDADMDRSSGINDSIFNLKRFSERTPSNNQLINRIVVQLLFMVTGRQNNYSSVANGLTDLRNSGEENIGQQIMQRMMDSLNDEHTIWFKKTNEEKEDIKIRFRRELLQAMKMIGKS